MTFSRNNSQRLTVEGKNKYKIKNGTKQRFSTIGKFFTPNRAKYYIKNLPAARHSITAQYLFATVQLFTGKKTKNLGI
jgi:hypothetical protein